MTWKVYRHDFNRGVIYEYDIFNNSRLVEDIQKLLKENITKEEFSEKLRRRLQYYYWAKSEHEIVITSWTPHIDKEELSRINTEYEEYYNKWGKDPIRFYINPDVAKKVDIYEQVRLNWNIFVDYVWSFKGGISNGQI